MTKRALILATFLVLPTLAILPLAGGCKKITQSATEKAIEEGTGAKKVDIDKGNITVVGPNGQKAGVGENVALPDGWPTSRVPVYPGCALKGAFSSGGQLSTIAETSDAPSKVIAFYKDKLSGYKTDAVASMGGMSTATFKGKDDDVAIVAGDGGGGGKTSITITITTHK